MALLGAAFAQEAEQAPMNDSPPTVDSSLETPAPTDESVMPVPALFVRLLDPADDQLEVPLSTTSVTLRGLTLPGVVLSIDGELTTVDDQGTFTAEVPLEEGANDITIAASDADGAMVESSLYVLRGD
jgi:hypothetical protein